MKKIGAIQKTSLTGDVAGRYTSSIRAWHNVKALTVDPRDPGKADPTCAKIVGYGDEWCIARGVEANVTTTLNLAMEASGRRVKLLGKMDTGGAPTMLPPGTPLVSCPHHLLVDEWRVTMTE